MSVSTPSSRPSPSVADLVAATPADRNRVVDLLRGAAILVVCLGHWLMAGVHVDGDGELRRTGLLGIATWTHPLTWVLQVMPVFFLVGGYANAISWRGARARGTTYGGWLRARLRRLTVPLLPLMLFWAVVAPLASALGVSGGTLRIASMASLVPTWFLAVYLLVVALTPLTLALWERCGWWSVLGGAAVAGLVDLVSVGGDLLAVGFVNYLFVWGTVHQLGYAWRDGALPGPAQRLGIAAVGLVGLLLLVGPGPYGVSMVGVGGHGVDNSYPARVTLLFLGLLQAGLVTALEPALARFAARPRVWAATVLVNARIMTIYLWHLTALGIVVGVSLAVGGLGLHLDPGSGAWWATRPLWFAVLAATTAALVALLGRLEQPAPDPRPAPPAVLPVAALLATCAGLAVMADLGIAAVDGTVNAWLPWVPLVAAVVLGTVRLPTTSSRRGR
ncbi:acyltransferase [Nocardioides sp. ChNu-153]|uniref:acyltransferase family protein n=1 Tax=unclassified Nocardioides TaxID=2615069 RepID=UPI002406135E|nr:MULTISPECIES: acyltransferase [unclassified Nocardioides]MDF9715841.1 acyltransferase [Nocardioides sp. ChNu-99]MDN7120779.1 acyltransferase [Nocardioides sp. ChNu-153]